MRKTALGALLACAVAVAVWWTLGGNAGVAVETSTPDARTGGRGALSAGAAESASSEANLAETEPEGRSAPPANSERSSTASENSWESRYPDAVLVEERFLQEQPEARLRQILLRTESSERDHVIWQERQELDGTSGSWAVVGVAAYAGDTVLLGATAEDVAAPDVQETLSQEGLALRHVSAVADMARVGVPNPSIAKLEQAVERLQAALPGSVVEWEVLHFPLADPPNDWRPDFGWGLEKANVPDAWQFGAGSDEVVIAVLDTGMDMDHPDLVDNLFVNPGEIAGNGVDDDNNGLVDDVSGWDFFGQDADSSDSDGHGTHVAGLAAARGDNGQGLVGVAWNAKILPLRVGNAASLETGSIVEAMGYVAKLKKAGVNVVVTNNSYGSELPSAGMPGVIEDHEKLGILFVAAAGNEASDLDTEAQSYPAGYLSNNIISVANSTQEDAFSSSSNTGAKSVDLAAPGTEVYSTYPNDRYHFLSGTSMSSPIVAGAVALLASAEPELTASQIKARLMDTVDPIASHEGHTVSGGRLNVLAALKPSLKSHGIAVPSHPTPIVISKDAAVPIEFFVEALPEATVTAELTRGQGLGSVSQAGDGVFRFAASGEGAFRLRFVAELEGVQRVAERSVFVGPVAEVSSGLSHRYDFGGGNATETDLAGSANGSYTGASKLNSEYGRVVRFPGEASSMSFDGSFSSQVTIAALVKNENLLSSSHPRIVNMPYYYLYFSSDSGLNRADGNRDTLKFFAEKDVSFGVWNAPPRSAKEGEWMYVVGTYDSRDVENRPSLYINGKAQPVWVQQEPIGEQNSTGGDSYLGNNDVADRPWSGLMGGVRIYNRQLGPAEIDQLGAVLSEKKWGRFTIAATHQFTVGEVATFVVRDFNGVAVDGVYEWSVLGVGGYELLERIGSEGRVRFSEDREYHVVAKVTDEVSTRYFSYSVTPRTNAPESGLYRGTTSGEGLIWLDVDKALASGTLTIMDPASGFYRIDEPVVIDEQGKFFTAENAAGRLEGVLDGGLKGEVAGFGITFSGGRETPSWGSNAFAGTYEGGGIETIGDRMVLEVRDDGTALFAREGEKADMGLGYVSMAGEIDLETVRGNAVSLRIDERRELVSGAVDVNGAITDAVLENVSYDSPVGLRGGVVASALPRSGQIGVFASFVGLGETASPQLGAGQLSAPMTSGGDALRMLLIDAKSRHVAARVSGGGFGIKTLSDQLANGVLSADVKPVKSIIAQLNVGSEGGTLLGFAIAGDAPQEILVRGLGPAFAESALRDPKIELFRLDSGEWTLLGENDNWTDGVLFDEDESSPQGAFKALEDAFEALAVPALELGALDASMRVWLKPGTYALRVTAPEGDNGEGLVELYELP